MAADVPEAIEDASWIAVRGGTVERICKVLGLTDPVPTMWADGMEVVGGNHEACPAEWPELAGVFMTPLIRGWRLAVGHYVGAGPLSHTEDDTRTSWRRVAGWCQQLSQEFGEAHAFTDQAQLDWYSWILARDGSILRQVVFDDGEFLSEKGQASGMEARLIARFKPDELRSRWQPDVGDVPRIAGESSVDPSRIGPRTRTTSQGYVAVTPWGRKQRVSF